MDMKEKTWEIYSKILSEKNIYLRYDNYASTASYDIENCMVTVPTFTFLNDTTTQLLVSHEIGHAKYSSYSLEQVESYILKYGDLFNVVEDAYIERKMKSEYKGLNNIFLSGYKELVDNNFFEIDESMLEELSLVSRLNIYAKLSHIYDVPFKGKEENEFAFRITRLKSNNDVIKLCDDILNYIKTNKNSNPQNYSNDGDSSSDNNKKNESTNNITKEKDSSELDKNNNSSSESNSEIESNSKNIDVESELSDEIQKTFNNNIEAYGRKKVKEDSNKNRIFYIKSDDYKNSCINLTKHNAAIESSYTSAHSSSEIKENVNLINNLAKYADMIFKQRKSAYEMKMTKNKKKGIIDTKRLSYYKISENIFRHVKLLPEGKNHGIVILIDFSNSMEGKLPTVIFQAAILAQFCYMNNIPFEIIAFGISIIGKNKSNNIFTPQTCAKISDSLHFSIPALLWYSEGENACSAFKIERGSTPMVDGIILASNTIAKMKNAGIEKTTLYMITDGMHDSYSNAQNITEINKIVYDGILYDIKSYITNKNIIHNDWVIELMFARLKKLYGTYITITFLDDMKDMLSSMSDELSSTYNQLKSPIYGSFICDEYFYLVKHGYYFENTNDIMFNIKNKITLCNFKHNPFIDQFQNLDIFNKTNSTSRNMYQNVLTNILNEYKLFKTYVNNYIKEIS